jgi:hypothetical protein
MSGGSIYSYSESMKLRIRANTLRLRLNQKEVERLAAGDVLQERIDFPGGTSLSYLLKVASAAGAEALFEGGRIHINLPRTPIVSWAHDEELGIYFSLPTGAEPLNIAIEKDLVCIDGPPEERDPLAFPREMTEKVC